MPFDGNGFLIPAMQPTPTAEIDPVTKLLIEARQRIVQNGWVQGAMYKHGGYCLAGAITTGNSRIDTWTPLECEAVRRMDRVIELLFGDANVIRWNDRPGRTKDEVLAALDQAIGSIPLSPSAAPSSIVLGWCAKVRTFFAF